MANSFEGIEIKITKDQIVFFLNQCITGEVQYDQGECVSLYNSENELIGFVSVGDHNPTQFEFKDPNGDNLESFSTEDEISNKLDQINFDYGFLV